ncbi:hypothetical protein Tco_1416931 [Tanacetum coccineum]
MEEASDLLEDSWFFGNLLDTKPRSISRCYSDLASSSCSPIQSYPHPPLRSTQEHVLKNEDKNSGFKPRKQPPITPSLTRTPSLPTFLTKNPNPSPNDQEKAIMKNDRKSSHVSSRKQPPVAPPSLTRRPSLPNSIEPKSFLTKDPNPIHDLSRTSSKSTPLSDLEDDDDQEREFSLGRLIRQASMNSSHTSTPPKQTSKAAVTENMQKRPELYQEKINDVRKMDRNRSKSIKNKNGGAPIIPGGLVDKNSSEDMKAHIKFWARAVASNVRQECS